jgi:hypothetical protein|tara:strand:+ start:837 stop:2036 length:1200 start_codon:yes stop_codon:yes gene_type:complete
MAIVTKRAQGGANAALLVAILAAFLITYILFLPQDDRDDLLDGKSISSSSSGSSNQELVELLKEDVGTLDPVDNVRDLDLPNINIFETTNAKVLDTITPFTVQNSWFVKKSRQTTFRINDLENADNIILNFQAPIRKGVLTIWLNGNAIFEYRVPAINAEPIKLRKELLKKDNEITFSVSSVGARFWATNEYSLNTIQIIGDISDHTRQEGRNTFTLTDTELRNIEKSEIRFIPYCASEADVGILDVSINGRNIFGAVPLCADRYEVAVPVSALRAGQNQVLFKTERGNYAIEQVKMFFTEIDTPEHVLFFEVNESTFDDISNNTHDAYIIVEFVDDTKRKKADLNINDKFIRIDQTKKVFERNIDSFVEEDNNFIKIIPDSILHIVEVIVELREQDDD